MGNITYTTLQLQKILDDSKRLNEFILSDVEGISEININDNNGGISKIEGTSTGLKITFVDDTVKEFLFSDEKGEVNGLATLDENGLIPPNQLPSYVNDVVELLDITDTEPTSAVDGDLYYNTDSHLIFTYDTDSWIDGTTPEKSKIYVNLNDITLWRWSGSELVIMLIAENIPYLNTASGLSATNVNDAIDEVQSNVDELINSTVSDKHYEHEQQIASDIWIVNHNLDKYPSVSVVDSANTKVIGEVIYITDKILHLEFSAPFSGKAYIN